MQTITVRGQGFGNKGVARPAVWENCESGNLSSDWTGAWPNRSKNKEYDTACRTPRGGIELPHGNVTRYVAGAHAEDGGYDAGGNVILFKARSITSYPAHTYASWYQRVDDAWQFCGDNNFKTYDFSTGTSPYDPTNWYIEYNPSPSNRTGSPYYHLNDNGSSLQNPSNWWWESAVNPMSGNWTKVEVEIRYARDSSGYIRVWENGSLRVNYQGRTDNYPGSQRNDGIGGYARCGGLNNWRYFSDIYLDHSLARVVLTDNADYSASKIIEPQIPTSWSNDSIEFKLNLGRLSPSDNAYIFVVSPDGVRSASGLPISTIAASPPKAPAPVQVQ